MKSERRIIKSGLDRADVLSLLYFIENLLLISYLIHHYLRNLIVLKPNYLRNPISSHNPSPQFRISVSA